MHEASKGLYALGLPPAKRYGKSTQARTYALISINVLQTYARLVRLP